MILIQGRKEKSFQSDIEGLLEDYRQTLVIQKQKELVLAKNLDTLITEEQINEAYEQIKKNSPVHNKLVKAELIICEENREEMLDLSVYFHANKWEEWNRILDVHPELKMIDSSKLIDWREIQQFIPSQVLSEKDIEADKKYEENHNGQVYFLKTFDVIDKNEIPPLSYMEPSIRKSILHRRRLEYLENYENQLYNKALEANKISIN